MIVGTQKSASVDEPTVDRAKSGRAEAYDKMLQEAFTWAGVKEAIEIYDIWRKQDDMWRTWLEMNMSQGRVITTNKTES